MTELIAWLARPFVQFGVVAIGSLALWAGFALHYEGKGADKLLIEIERSNNAAASNARAGARGVTDRRVRGVEDPNAVDE